MPDASGLSIDLTWTCHVCGRERPDDKISVLSVSHMHARGFEVRHNVRYCNDRPECAAGAIEIEAKMPV
jgi:predicted subunit of tRNA(5-methylaminomethyl-2-thiouridylate) methyltransferase